jgi:hypothetical protein
MTMAKQQNKTDTIHWVSTVNAAKIIGSSRQWVRMLAVNYGQVRYVRLPKNAIAVCLEDVLRWKRENPNPRRKPQKHSAPTTMIDIDKISLTLPDHLPA